MPTDLESNFTSLRRALKICSLLLVLFGMIHFPTVLNQLGRTEVLWYSMMGDADVPWVFLVSRFMQNYFIFFGIGFLAVFAGCVFYTRKSKGGGFLYLNVGIYLGFLAINSLLLDAAQKIMREPLEAINGL